MKIRSKSFKKHICVGSSLMLAAVLASAGTATAFASGSYTVDKTFESYVEEAQALNGEIMQEGMVLLRNMNSALPLGKGSKVSVLGAGSYKTAFGEITANTDACYVSDSLTAAGFEVNPDIKGVYAENMSTKKIGGVDVLIEPSTSVFDGVNLSGYSDAAIITITRTCKEAADLVKDAESLSAFEIEAAHQLALYPSEKALIKMAKENFDKVIILLNTATMVQIPELNEDGGEYEADAIMYIGLPGTTGLRTLGNVLNGDVSPSGRTADTWYTDFTKDPTYQNATSNISDIQGSLMIEYEEGIYLGYKYYETAYAEIAAGNYSPDGYTLNGTGKDAADDWYGQAVTYPFGYGLSYTTFSQKILTESIDISGKSFDDYVNVSVEVTNTGDVAGKEVVQIYAHAPYTKNGIEKSEVVLAGFAKTDTIEAGNTEIVSVSIRVGDLASYDYSDANGDDWYGYEIEAGDYELRLQSDAHDVIDTLSFNVATTVKFENDGTLASGTNSVENTVFSKGDDFDSLKLASEENGGDFVIMSRADFKGTFPTAPTGNNNYKEGFPTKYSSEFTPDMDDPDDYWYVESVPEGWTQGSGTSYVLSDMSGIEINDQVIEGGLFDGKTGKEAWEQFMNQLTWDELKTAINTGNFGTPSIPSINKAAEVDVNGPEQIGDNGTSWACANIMAGTFNEDLLYQRGVASGNEALYNGYSGWYGPTANLNRTPFGGRNNIYYSEDALLTGKVAANLIKGVQSRGVVAYVKHFVLNEQETNRTGLGTFLTEQALRETYLKAFEYAVKEGGTLGMMQCMNRIGGVNGFGNYGVDKAVLRDEWGYNGVLVTDSYSSRLVRENMAQRMGGDLPLGTWPIAVVGDWDASANMVTYKGVASPTQWSVVRTSAMHVLYAAANGMLTYNGYNIAAFTTQNVYEGLTEKKLRYNIGSEVTLNVGVSADVLGTDNVIYTATGLPTGLTIDSKTGVISGTVTEECNNKVVVTLSVLNEGEEWIKANISITMVVETAQEDDENVVDEAAASGCSGTGCGSISTSVGTIVSSFIIIGGLLAVTHYVYGKKGKAEE